jgi:membrane-associated HD superfamily phosphohydrolase
LSLENITLLTNKINYTPILFNTIDTNNDNDNDIDIIKPFCVFYVFNYTTEKINQNNESIQITIENIFMVLYKNKIHYNINELIKESKNNVTQDITQTKNKQNDIRQDIKQEIENNVTQENKKNKQNDIRQDIKQEIENNVTQENKQNDIRQDIKQEIENNKRLTIGILKDYLKKLNLKTSGNKEELQLRLNSYLKKND